MVRSTSPRSTEYLCLKDRGEDEGRRGRGKGKRTRVSEVVVEEKVTGKNWGLAKLLATRNGLVLRRAATAAAYPLSSVQVPARVLGFKQDA